MRYPTLLPSAVRLSALALALPLAACATGMARVDPAEIPRLEREVAANPSNTDIQVRLGIARFLARDVDRAREALQAAVDAGNQSGEAFFYLGLTHEEAQDWSAARDAYSRYLATGARGSAADEIRKRLQLVGRHVLRQQAQASLAREAELSDAPPAPRSVAVFPFAFNSDREDLEPLIYSLADMMITDLSVSNALTVLERVQIQALLDEMALTEAGYAEPTTGARAGRILRAEHVVQGVLTTLGEEVLRLDTDVLNTPRGASAGTVSAEDRLQNLFDMQKELVFRTLRDVLRVELTPAEEQRIRENRAQNVLAFLAYGRGLRAKDQGEYGEALAAFRQAMQLDPGFAAAAVAANETEDISDAAATPPSQVAQTGPTPQSSEPTILSGVSEGVNPSPTGGTLGQDGSQGGGDPPKRDAVQESQGQESTKPPAAQIRIVIKRPGGGQ